MCLGKNKLKRRYRTGFLVGGGGRRRGGAERGRGFFKIVMLKKTNSQNNEKLLTGYECAIENWGQNNPMHFSEPCK